MVTYVFVFYRKYAATAATAATPPMLPLTLPAAPVKTGGDGLLAVPLLPPIPLLLALAVGFKPPVPAGVDLDG